MNGQQNSNRTLSPNSSPEYWRGAVARLQYMIDDTSADDDAPNVAWPDEPEGPTQFWAGWNSIARLSPAVGDLPMLMVCAVAKMGGAV